MGCATQGFRSDYGVSIYTGRMGLCSSGTGLQAPEDAVRTSL